ncbi:MAG: hypothetical protein JWR80_143 [Bradyrhizobium sp.]|nr:hypothetical protein [Bradyrhizobium sp.]
MRTGTNHNKMVLPIFGRLGLSFTDRISCREVSSRPVKLLLLFVGFHGLLGVVCVFVMRRRIKFFGHYPSLYGT